MWMHTNYRLNDAENQGKRISRDLQSLNAHSNFPKLFGSLHIHYWMLWKKCPFGEVVFFWEGFEICFSFCLRIMETLVIPTLVNQIQESAITLSCFFNVMLKGPHKGFFCHLAFSFTTITQIQWLCCYGLIKKNCSLPSCFLQASSNPQKFQYTIALS